MNILTPWSVKAIYDLTDNAIGEAHRMSRSSGVETEVYYCVEDRGEGRRVYLYVRFLGDDAPKNSTLYARVFEDMQFVNAPHPISLLEYEDDEQRAP